MVPRDDPQRRRIGHAEDVRVAVALGREVADVPLGTLDERGLVEVQDPEDVAERDAVRQQPRELADRDALAAHDAVRVGAREHHRLDALVGQAVDDAHGVRRRCQIAHALRPVVACASRVPSTKPS